VCSAYDPAAEDMGIVLSKCSDAWKNSSIAIREKPIDDPTGPHVGLCVHALARHEPRPVTHPKISADIRAEQRTANKMATFMKNERVVNVMAFVVVIKSGS
jgi:hypothetical protein